MTKSRQYLHLASCFLAVASLILTGCGQQQEPSSSAAAPAPATSSGQQDVAAATQAAKEAASEVVDQAVAVAQDNLDRLVQAFEQADAATLANVKKAVAAVREASFADALPLLQQVAQQKLTPEQNQLLQDVIDMVSKHLAPADANDAVSDLKKSLPLGQ